MNTGGFNVVNLEVGTLISKIKDKLNAVGFQFKTDRLTDPTAKLISLKNGDEEVFYIDIEGKIYSRGELIERVEVAEPVPEPIVEEEPVHEPWMSLSDLTLILEFDNIPFSPYHLRTLVGAGLEEDQVMTLNEALGQTYTPTDLSFLRAKAHAAREIDIAAGDLRRSRTTHTFNQAEILREKVDEAIDFLTQPNAKIEHFPFIRAHCNATGVQPLEAATTFIARRKAWVALNAKIEEVREHGKKLLRDLPLDKSDQIDPILNESLDQLKLI